MFLGRKNIMNINISNAMDVDSVDIQVVVAAFFDRRLPATVILIVFCVLGVPGNIIVLMVYWRENKMTTTKIIISILAVSDLLASSVMIPLLIVLQLFYFDVQNIYYCKISRIGIVTYQNSTQYLLVGLSAVRYCRVCKPHMLRGIDRKLKVFFTFALCSSLVLGVFSAIIFGKQMWPTADKDLPGFKCAGDLKYKTTLLRFMFIQILFTNLFGLIMICVLNFSIVKAIIKRKKLLSKYTNKRKPESTQSKARRSVGRNRSAIGAFYDEDTSIVKETRDRNIAVKQISFEGSTSNVIQSFTESNKKNSSIFSSEGKTSNAIKSFKETNKKNSSFLSSEGIKSNGIKSFKESYKKNSSIFNSEGRESNVIKSFKESNQKKSLLSPTHVDNASKEEIPSEENFSAVRDEWMKPFSDRASFQTTTETDDNIKEGGELNSEKRNVSVVDISSIKTGNVQSRSIYSSHKDYVPEKQTCFRTVANCVQCKGMDVTNLKVSVVNCVYLITYLPYMAAGVSRSPNVYSGKYHAETPNHDLYKYVIFPAFGLIFLRGAVNPLIYLFLDPTFRRQCHALFRRT